MMINAISGDGATPLFAVEEVVVRRRRDGAEVGRHRIENGWTLAVIEEQLASKSAAEFAKTWCRDESP